MNNFRISLIPVTFLIIAFVNGCYEEEIEVTGDNSPSAIVSPVVPPTQAPGSANPVRTSAPEKTNRPQAAASPAKTAASAASTAKPANPSPTAVSTAAPSPVATAISQDSQAFRNSQVVKTGENKYKVTGQARTFEATVSFVVEDGHNELYKGFTTASQGAPEWGNFSAEFTVKKERPNSTLTLIVFEESARDGSRVNQIYLPLPE